MYAPYVVYMEYTESDVTTVHLRRNLSDCLDRVQHQGERLLVTRAGKPAAFLAPTALLAEVDAYLRTERGLSGVTSVSNGKETRYTRDELAAQLRDRGDSLHLGDDETKLRTADLDVIARLLGEFAAQRTDALAELADDWSARLNNMVADAQTRVW